MPILTTARLLLRPLEQADAVQIQALFPRWEIVRFMASQIPWPYPPDGALVFIRDVALPAVEAGTEWHWTLRRLDDQAQVIGFISLKDRSQDNRGLWLYPAWQGVGLMSEAIDAVTEFWFETLGRRVLQVRKAALNLRSRRISERGGMRLIGHTAADYVCGHQLPTDIWEITREEWRARHGGVEPRPGR